MMEERPDRRQARITCLDRVLPLLLKLVQKRENEIAVQILGRQCARLAPGALGGEEDESRFRKSAQDDKWSFCLTVGTLCPVSYTHLTLPTNREV